MFFRNFPEKLFWIPTFWKFQRTKGKKFPAIRFWIQDRPFPTQRMSSTAWICAVKWGADGRCDTPPQMQKQPPWSSASEKGIDSLAVQLITITLLVKSNVSGVAYCRYQPDSEGVYPLSTSARPGRLFCIWGGAPYLPAPHFTTQIQPVLLIHWVGEGRYRTRNLVVPSRMLYRLSKGNIVSFRKKYSQFPFNYLFMSFRTE